MKNVVVFLSLIFVTVLAQADLGSAEIYLMKYDHSFDFLSVDHTGQVRVNNEPGSTANLNTLLAMNPQYTRFCFDGPMAPLQILVNGLVHNTPNVTLNGLVSLPGRGVEAQLTIKTTDSESQAKFVIQNCDF